MGHGPGKKRALAAAGFPGIVWRAASCTHVARQVAKDAATSATLEIELTVLAQPPELLFDRVLRPRLRLGRRCLRGGPRLGRHLMLFAHANLLRIALLTTHTSPQHATRPVGDLL